jgi:predicted alpha-1,2-mannosidase
MGPDWQVHTSEVTQYTLFSLWDTFRALHPFLTIMHPGKDADMIESMVNIYKNRGGYETGRLPRWWLANGETECMTGTHAASAIADAYVKGITGFDAATAYEAMCKDSTVPGVSVVPHVGYGSFGEGRYGLAFYNALGYVPADLAAPYDNPIYIGTYAYNQGVSRTLEYAYDDFCIAQMANAMGNSADYETYMAKAGNYKNTYDSETGFMRGKSISGQWMDEGNFDPTMQYAYYTEGNAWQWTWFVPQDVPGLIELMGGNEKFAQKLDSLFSQSSAVTASVDVSGLIGQYAQGNEPVHHVAYLYDYAGQPWKTQEKVRQVMDTLYLPTNGGLCGNDDCGQMSAWYVLSAMGFYQVCPGVPIYAIGSPIFDKIVIHQDNGKDFTIEAKNNSAENKYIQSATLNDAPLQRAFFSHSDIVSGARLVLEMGALPNTQWGTMPVVG